MKRFIIAGLFLILLCGIAPAASVTVTSGTFTVPSGSATEGGASKSLGAASGSGVTRYTLDWLSDASGNCVATLAGIQGLILRVTVVPDTGGTTPDDDYSIVAADGDSVDVFMGLFGAMNDTGTSNTSVLLRDGNTTTDIPLPTLGNLTLTIASAGNANGGKIQVYTKP